MRREGALSVFSVVFVKQGREEGIFFGVGDVAVPIFGDIEFAFLLLLFVFEL